MLEILFLSYLSYRHQRPQMIITLILTARKRKHYFDRLFTMRKFYPVNCPNQQNIELVTAVNYNMRYRKTRLNNRPTFALAMNKFLKQNIFTRI